MYQSPNGSGQWPPQNGPPPPGPNQQQQQPGPPPQPQWSPQPPPNGPYQPGPPQQQQQRPPSNQGPGPNQNQIPSITQAGLPPGAPMQTLHPPQQDPYRPIGPTLPPPHQIYGAPYQNPPMGYPPQQAPRQRTAIACRYCRRRKIRCSGFENSEDGRCTNCQRFSQECVFTPVSAQTQAFVPAHTVWRGQNPPPNAQLYGAFGQPLPQAGRGDPYPAPGAPGQPQQVGQYPPPPQGYQQQLMYGAPPAPIDKDSPESILAINERHAERRNNGEVKDMGVQVDISKEMGV